MYQHLFKESLKHHEGKLPFQAHSHHFWPDASFNGVRQSWEDSIKFADNKWDRVFQEIIPSCSRHLQTALNFDHIDQVTFAQNTHELVFRWLSSFTPFNKLTVLTTDSEFYSIGRQLERLSEEGTEIHKLDTQVHKGDTHKITSSIINTTQRLKPKVLIFSQTFFNSSYMLSDEQLELIVNSVDEDVHILIDGYHAFGTKEFNLSNICKRAYYVAGGYKYAMGGEGSCFMISPEKSLLRPLYTGWFADFESLANQSGKVNYAQGAMRFMGATFDPTSLYRFNATWDSFIDQGIGLNDRHEYVRKLQKLFLATFKNHPNILFHDLDHHGHFFTFRFESHKQANQIFKNLSSKGIFIDKRKNDIRFGFGIYQSEDNVRELIELLINSLDYMNIKLRAPMVN